MKIYDFVLDLFLIFFILFFGFKIEQMKDDISNLENQIIQLKEVNQNVSYLKEQVNLLEDKSSYFDIKIVQLEEKL